MNKKIFYGILIISVWVLIKWGNSPEEQSPQQQKQFRQGVGY